jgi:hypothetical protein
VSRRDRHLPALPRTGHNGGPSLEEPPHRPPWGRGIGTYFAWEAAHDAVWRKVPRDILLRRLDNAERIGLTYEEYTLEILERGRYLTLPDDAERIAQIKQARRRRRR